MTVRREERNGEFRWVIDISYRTIGGKAKRYRRDAQVQLKKAAEAENRRLEDHLANVGTLEQVDAPPEPDPVTFADAVKHFRATHMKSALKPTTGIGYNVQLDTLLLPRFGALPLETIDRQALALLDAELVDEGLAPSTRARFHIVVRSVLRTAVNAGMLAAMPVLPRLPKSGRKAVNPMRRPDLDAILAAASPTARVAFQLAAFAGLRAGEVRGLRWPDVDLDAGTLTIRRSISAGFETTPKSQRGVVNEISFRLFAAISSTGQPLSKIPASQIQECVDQGLRHISQMRQVHRTPVAPPDAMDLAEARELAERAAKLLHRGRVAGAARSPKC